MPDQPIGVTKWDGGAQTFVDPAAERNEGVTLQPNGYCSAPANSPRAVGIAYFGPRLLDPLVDARLRQQGRIAVDESRLRAVLAVGDFAVEEVLAHLTGRPVEA